MRPDRNEVDASLGDSADRLECHSARRFERNAAGDQRHRLAQASPASILSSNSRSAPASSAGSICSIRSTSTCTCKTGVRRLGAPDRLGDAAADRDVIVLDQHAVIETHSMIVRAAHARGIFLEKREPGDRLARVEQHRAACRRSRRHIAG